VKPANDFVKLQKRNLQIDFAEGETCENQKYTLLYELSKVRTGAVWFGL
jgi:hypothetical protein